MTEIGKKDKLPIKSPTTIAQFEPSARKELIVRGLMELADVHDADFYFFKGEDFRLHGKYRDAIANYNKAIYIDPEHEGSLFEMGYCYYPNGEEDIVDDVELDNTTRFERAASTFQKLIALGEKKDNIWWDHYPVYYNLGLTQYSLDLYEKAIENFERAITLNPDDAESYYMIGLAQYNLDLYEKAIESFERAIELNPDDHKSHYMLGLSQYYLKLYEKAIESFKHAKHAIELNPDEKKGKIERQDRIEELEIRIEELERSIAELEKTPTKKTS